MIQCFDIETGPLPDEKLSAMIDPFPPYQKPPPFNEKDVKLGNTKAEDKIKEKIEEARQKYELMVAGSVEKQAADKLAYEQEARDKAALHAHHGRVLAIGLFNETDGFWILGNDDERQIIRDFWAWFNICLDMKNKIVGFNIFGFDLPFLVRRSWILGETIPSQLMIHDKFWSEVFLDLAKRWQCAKPNEFTSLDTVSRALGCGQKNGDGAEFAKLWFADRKQAVEYLRNDLDMTFNVAQRLGVR